MNHLVESRQVKGFSQSQLNTIQLVERISSSLSLMGAAFIITTFISSKRFRIKPVNRLVFIATFGNIFSNVATVISRSGPDAGPTSPLCNFQAFLIQSFLPADVMLCSCMALNVYLTVCKNYSSNQLRKLEYVYIIVCYSVPVIVGIIFAFISTPAKGSIYGDATLWCWIDSQWEYLRLAAFYGPVWLIIVMTIGLYIRAGCVIWGFRHNLRVFGKFGKNVSGNRASRNGHKSHNSAIQMTMVTQIEVVQTPMKEETPSHLQSDSFSAPMTGYSCTITTGQVDDQDLDNIDLENGNNLDKDNDVVDDLGQRSASPIDEPDHVVLRSNTINIVDIDRIQPPSDPKAAKRALARAKSTLRANRAAWAYARCAFLFFFALIITWLPSSMNRVYAFIHRNEPHFGLSIASGIVLPSQGFWNSIIYIYTTWDICKMVWHDLTFQLRTWSCFRPRQPAPVIKTSLYSISTNRTAST